MEYFKAYTSWLDDIWGLSESERGRLFTSLLQYAASGEKQEPRGSERILFHKLVMSIDKDAQDAQNLHNIYINNNSKDLLTQASKQEHNNTFDMFWNAYPKGYRTNKKRCVDLWKKLKPDEQTIHKMVSSINEWKQTRQWQQGYVPNPDTWLRNEKWNDEIPPQTACVNTRQNNALRYSQKQISEKDFDSLLVDLENE